MFSADKDSVSVEVLASLVEEASKLSKSKLKCGCRKAGTPGPYGWIHLVDLACYAWQPREEPKP